MAQVFLIILNSIYFVLAAKVALNIRREVVVALGRVNVRYVVSVTDGLLSAFRALNFLPQPLRAVTAVLNEPQYIVVDQVLVDLAVPSSLLL